MDSLGLILEGFGSVELVGDSEAAEFKKDLSAAATAVEPAARFDVKWLGRAVSSMTHASRHRVRIRCRNSWSIVDLSGSLPNARR